MTRRLFFILASLVFLLGPAAWAYPARGLTPFEAGLSQGPASPPWGLDLRTFVDGPAFSGPAELFSEYQLALRRTFTRGGTLSGAVRLQAIVSSTFIEVAPSDPFIEGTLPTLGEFGNWQLEVGLRYFVPVSSFSRRIESTGILAPSIWLGRLGRKWEFGYTFTPSWVLGGNSSEAPKATHRHLFEIGYRIAQAWRLDTAFYPAWTRNASGGTRPNQLPISLGFTYFVSRTASLSPYLEIPLRGKSSGAGRVSLTARLSLL